MDDNEPLARWRDLSRLEDRLDELQRRVEKLEALLADHPDPEACPECTGNGFPYPGILYDPNDPAWRDPIRAQRCDRCRRYVSDQAAYIALRQILS